MSIRNFCIIAHIDHGKSTLADRLLEITGTIDKRDMKHGQTLDMMDLEQERGITIKLTPVRMQWKGYELNLIDTPGHVDFQYEVSRSLASVEGAVLVVDATQGIEAQTLSNVYMALGNDLTIIPVLNKIDLPSADVPGTTKEIINLLGCREDEIIALSAKTGENVEALLDAVIERIPLPRKLDKNAKLVEHDNPAAFENQTKGLIFDSQYDSYKGVVVYLKLFAGKLKRGDKISLLHTDAVVEVQEVGYFDPKYHAIESLNAGQIGYMISGLKTIADAKVGDTIFNGPTEDRTAIAGFKQVTPYIFAGIYPADTDEYPKLKESMDKLMLNDSSLTKETEMSPALGFGFRCGFLGLLHLDIVRERLLREFDMDIIITSPQVTYQAIIPGSKLEEFGRFSPELMEFEGRTSTKISFSNPDDMPKAGTFSALLEPIARVELITPAVSIGGLMKLAQERRGLFKNQTFLDEKRVVLTYEIPMAEIITDFYDSVKSVSSGYASVNYEFAYYRQEDLVKLDIIIAQEPVDAFSSVVHRTRAREVGIRLCEKLKESIPKAQFAIAIQAAVGANVIARETIGALKKDVTAKLYG